MTDIEENNSRASFPNEKSLRAKPILRRGYQWDGTQAEAHMMMAWIMKNGGTAWSRDEYDVIMMDSPLGVINIRPSEYVILDEFTGRLEVFAEPHVEFDYEIS